MNEEMKMALESLRGKANTADLLALQQAEEAIKRFSLMFRPGLLKPFPGLNLSRRNVENSQNSL